VAPPEGFVMDFKMADGGGVGWVGGRKVSKIFSQDRKLR
jgi:hypothetical protein